MQQLSSFPLLGPAHSSAGKAFNNGEAQAVGINSVNMDKLENSESGVGFSVVFSSVATTETSPLVEAQPISWDQFLDQYPELAEQLGTDIDLNSFFSQFQVEGQSFAQIVDGQGEMLPLDLDYAGLNESLQDMTAWFKDIGIELTVDESGQIVPLDMSGMADIDAEVAHEAIENLAQTIAQLFSSLEQQKKELMQSQLEEDRAGKALGKEQVLLSGAKGEAEQRSFMKEELGPNKGQVVSTFAHTIRGGVADSAQTNASNASQLQGGAVSASAQVQNVSEQGLQQGFSQQSQSETNQQFKQSMEAAALSGAGVDSVDELVSGKTGETISARFSDIQARVPGESLKQYATGINTPVGNPEWADQMSQKIIWLTGRSIQSAEIHLNPAELGPVEVKINVQNEQAAISFNAQHASVRELLESNVHRLREMMNSNGVELADVNVGSGDQQEPGFSQEFAQQSKGAGRGLPGHEEELVEGERESATVTETSVGLVDYYA